jgi:hypothetical protein
MTAAGIEDGRLLRSISKGGKVGESLREALQEEWRRPGTN